MTTPMITEHHIRQSNLIEHVTSEIEVEQSWMAWNIIKDHPGPLTEELVMTVHNIIMYNFLPAMPGGRGTYRLVNVTVGGRDCPRWQDVPALFKEWLTKMEHWSLDFEPVKAHIAFEHIHPFVDGNGRTGRMLFWWHEIKAGLVPTLITYSNRWSYYDWFDKS